MLIEDITGTYNVVQSPGFKKDVKKWMKKRKGAKGKENPASILPALMDKLATGPKDPSPPFEFHKINKSRKSTVPEWSAKVSRKFGERAIYTVDEDTRTVTLDRLRLHNDVYSESLEYDM